MHLNFSAEMNVGTTLTQVFLNYVFIWTIKICVKVTAQQFPEEKFGVRIIYFDKKLDG